MSWLSIVDAALDDLTTLQRAATSAATLVALGVVVFLARRERSRRDSRVWSRIASVTSLAALVVASGVLVAVWNIEESTGSVLQSAQMPSPEFAVKLFLSIALFAAVYVGTGVVHRLVERFMKDRAGITDHQAEVTYRIIQIVVYVMTLLVVLGFWGTQLSGLLIGAGFAGIVLGMAARQTLGAVLAGFVLMFARPFEIGDWVKIGDKDGIVTDITIVNTRLQTFDGEYVILPNDYVGESEVVNRSEKGRLRIHVEVGVDYSTDVDHACDVAKDAMTEVEDILSVPRPQVVLKELGGSSVVLDLRFWIDKPSARRMWRAQTSVISAVKSAFEEEDITIPFPQHSLSARDPDGGFRVQQPPTGTEPPENGRSEDGEELEPAVEQVEGEDD